MNCLGKLSRDFGPHAGAGPAAHDHRPDLGHSFPWFARSDCNRQPSLLCNNDGAKAMPDLRRPTRAAQRLRANQDPPGHTAKKPLQRARAPEPPSQPPKAFRRHFAPALRRNLTPLRGSLLIRKVTVAAWRSGDAGRHGGREKCPGLGSRKRLAAWRRLPGPASPFTSSGFSGTLWSKRSIE